MKKISLFMLMMAGVFTGCKDTNTPFPVKNKVVYKGTQSPGDVWTWELDKVSNTFSATWDYGTFDNTADDISVSGSYEELPSGYLKITLSSVTPSSLEVPTDGSAFFYALEIPNMVLILKPEGSIKGDIIALVAQGNCSDVAGTYHYFFTSPGNGNLYDSYTEEAFGQATFTDNGGTFSIAGSKSSLDCLDGIHCTVTGPITGLPSAVCEMNGEIKISDPGGVTLSRGQFTQAGVFMLDMGPGNGGLFGLRSDASITVNDLKSTMFNGLAYLPANNIDKTVPVKLEFSALGVGAGYAYTDIENNLVDAAQGVSITIDSITDGFVLGKIGHQSGGITSFAGSLLKSGTSKIMVLVSTTDEAGNPPFILVLTSK